MVMRQLLLKVQLPSGHQVAALCVIAEWTAQVESRISRTSTTSQADDGNVEQIFVLVDRPNGRHSGARR